MRVEARGVDTKGGSVFDLRTYTSAKIDEHRGYLYLYFVSPFRPCVHSRHGEGVAAAGARRCRRRALHIDLLLLLLQEYVTPSRLCVMSMSLSIRRGKQLPHLGQQYLIQFGPDSYIFRYYALLVHKTLPLSIQTRKSNYAHPIPYAYAPK